MQPGVFLCFGKQLVFDEKLNYDKKNIRVLPDDTDAFGRLNWQAYVRYCEEGEAGLMEMLGFSIMHFYREQKISFPRRAATFEYLSPVSPDSLIDIETMVKKLGKTSFTLSHSFFKKNSEDGERILSAKAEVTAVAFNDQIHEKVELPVELKEALRRIL
jgi:YbgC/YbaW family acyl-CoA thioester hydrolase